VRRLLIVLAVLSVLAVGALFALGQWLGRGHLRAAVEARLTATLGQPVSVGRLGVTLLPRLALSGADVRVGEAREQAPAVQIERIRILPRIRPLIRGDVVVEQIELDGFVVAVLRDEIGRWHVPSAVPAPTAGSSTVVIERVRVTDGRVLVFDRAQGSAVQETASIEDLDTDVTVEANGLRLAPITGRIGDATISGDARTDASGVRLQFDANDITDGDLPVFLRLLGSERPAFLKLAQPASAAVTVHVGRASSRLTGKGVLRAPEVLLEPLRLQRFEAPLVIAGSRLQFNPTAFAMYGGGHRGTVTMQLSEVPPLWTTDSRVTSLNLGEFLSALMGRDQQVDGTASVNAALRGRIGQPLDRTARGRIELTVTKGVIRQFPLLATINRALRLSESEGKDTRFERLSATFAVADGQATTDDLVLEAGHVRVMAAGRIGADRSLALRGAAVVSADRVAGAVASIRELARLRNSRGEIEVPLTISGTLDAPSFGLDLNAAVRQGLADELRRRLRKFIR
jgi:AsmA protein